jgi:CRISPR-associated RAMP protein (TIGR02581 family)
MMFDKFENRLVLTGWLVAKTALRVGAGRATEPGGSDLPVLRDSQGRPYIPGSSFKGVLRSRVESLVRAVVPDPAKGACLPTGGDEERCLPANDITEGPRAGVKGIGTLKERARKEKWPDSRLAEEIWNRSCLVCRIFGSPWLASHVQIKDLLVDPTIWFDQYQVRDGVAIDRDTETAGERLLYDYEVVPADTRFRCEIVVDNAIDNSPEAKSQRITHWPLGMLFLGLKPFEQGEIAIGGFRSRGLGTVKLGWEERTYFAADGDVDRLIRYLQGEDVAESVTDERVKEWIDQFRRKLAGLR